MLCNRGEGRNRGKKKKMEATKHGERKKEKEKKAFFAKQNRAKYCIQYNCFAPILS